MDVNLKILIKIKLILKLAFKFRHNGPHFLTLGNGRRIQFHKIFSIKIMFKTAH